MPSNLQTQEALQGDFFGFNENSRPKRLEGYIVVLIYHSGKEFIFINKYIAPVYIHIGFKNFQFRKAHKVAKALIQIKVEILIKIYPII